MTDKQKEGMRKLFSMLADAGCSPILIATPLPGAEQPARFEPDGTITAVDKRDGKRKQIKLSE